MSNKDAIELEGTVIDIYPGTKFKVELENGLVITAYLNGKLRQNHIRVIEGDSVIVELSPYDLTQGRIIWRNK